MSFKAPQKRMFIYPHLQYSRKVFYSKVERRQSTSNKDLKEKRLRTELYQAVLDEIYTLNPELTETLKTDLILDSNEILDYLNSVTTVFPTNNSAIISAVELINKLLIQTNPAELQRFCECEVDVELDELERCLGIIKTVGDQDGRKIELLIREIQIAREVILKKQDFGLVLNCLEKINEKGLIVENYLDYNKQILKLCSSLNLNLGYNYHIFLQHILTLNYQILIQNLESSICPLDFDINQNESLRIFLNSEYSSHLISNLPENPIETIRLLEFQSKKRFLHQLNLFIGRISNDDVSKGQQRALIARKLDTFLDDTFYRYGDSITSASTLIKFKGFLEQWIKDTEFNLNFEVQVLFDICSAYAIDQLLGSQFTKNNGSLENYVINFKEYKTSDDLNSALVCILHILENIKKHLELLFIKPNYLKNKLSNQLMILSMVLENGENAFLSKAKIESNQIQVLHLDIRQTVEKIQNML